MKRLKRLISILLCGCVLCGVIFTQVGAKCSVIYNTKKIVVGDFVVRFDDKKNPETYFFYELTENAKNKKSIIIPSLLNGKTLKAVRQNELNIKQFEKIGALNNYGNFSKIYTIGEINREKTISKVIGGYLIYEFENRARCIGSVLCYLSENDNVEKVMYNHFYISKNFFEDTQKRIFVNYGLFENLIKYILTYGELSMDFCINNDISEFTNGQINSDNVKYGIFSNKVALSNLQFLYNYDNCPNYGYYWIDDIESGEKIEVIPENPTREGYTFGGWYTEPECENEFDFNTPITKQKVNWDKIYNLEETLPIDYVTFLYAKWIENN